MRSVDDGIDARVLAKTFGKSLFFSELYHSRVLSLYYTNNAKVCCDKIRFDLRHTCYRGKVIRGEEVDIPRYFASPLYTWHTEFSACV